MNFEEWRQRTRIVGGSALAKEAWNAAIREAAKTCSHRFLGGGSPGGGISDLDDLDRDTQQMCAEAVLGLEAK